MCNDLSRGRAWFVLPLCIPLLLGPPTARAAERADAPAPPHTPVTGPQTPTAPAARRAGTAPPEHPGPRPSAPASASAPAERPAPTGLCDGS